MRSESGKVTSEWTSANVRSEINPQKLSSPPHIPVSPSFHAESFNSFVISQDDDTHLTAPKIPDSAKVEIRSKIKVTTPAMDIYA